MKIRALDVDLKYIKAFLECDIFYLRIRDMISFCFPDEGIFLYQEFVSKNKEPVCIEPHASPERSRFRQDNVIVGREFYVFKEICLGE